MNNELLKKLKKLAENGVGGEKINAQKMLEKLMKQYNISEEDLNEDVIKEFNFKVPKHFKALELFIQVAYAVIETGVENGKGVYKGYKRHFVKCTSAEFVEIKARFDFYFYHLKKELNRYYIAFVQANRIFPINDKGSDKELTEEEIAALRLSRSIDKHDYLLQIESKGETK